MARAKLPAVDPRKGLHRAECIGLLKQLVYTHGNPAHAMALKELARILEWIREEADPNGEHDPLGFQCPNCDHGFAEPHTAGCTLDRALAQLGVPTPGGERP